jgi:hypothetical protein
MVVKVSKPEINVREKISELDKPSGTAGQAMLAAETPQEQFNLIGAGRRNLVINGSMMINQRGNIANYATSTNSEIYGGPDRFINTFIGTVSMNQSSDVPEGYGFEYSREVLCAATGTQTGRYMAFVYRMEGYDSMVFDYGTPMAKHVTLSFWIKSNRACDISVNFENEQNPDRGYQVKQSINSADTWEKKIITIPGDTARTLTTGPQKAFCFDIFLSAFGNTFTGGTPSEVWSDLSNSQRGEHCSSDFYDSTSNYFRLTGVQLELGKVATPFEHRSYGEEYALCQRYYQRFDADGQDFTNIGVAIATTAAWYVPIILPGGRMRADPTLSYSAVGDFRVTLQHSNTNAVTSMIIGYANPLHPNLSVQAGSNSTSNGARMFGYASSTTAWLAFDAEL